MPATPSCEPRATDGRCRCGAGSSTARAWRCPWRRRSRCTGSPRGALRAPPRSPPFPSTIRGSTCTSRGTWPRARASPITPGCPSRDRRRRSGRCCWPAPSRSPALRPPGPRHWASPPRSPPRLLTRRLVWMWTESRALALAGGVIASVAGPLVWGALSGMEVSLAALLVTGALVLHTEGRAAPTALLLGLAVLTRPESLLLVPLVWLGRPITPRRTAIFAGVVGALLAPWIAFNLATAGTPLPATASAKVEGGLIGVLSGGRTRSPRRSSSVPGSSRRNGFDGSSRSAISSCPCCCFPGSGGSGGAGARGGLPALVLVLHPLGMALLAPYRGPAFQEGRYSIHVVAPRHHGGPGRRRRARR